MNNLTRVKVSMISMGTIFWIPIIVSFFRSKGFPLNEVYFLMTLYSVSVVLLEFPTGVVGDYFSHRFSMQLGLFLLGIGTLLSILTLPRIVYYLLLFIQSLGFSLTSGSDIALLHSHSKNFKKDVSDTKYLSIIGLLVGTTLGGFLGGLNLNYPVFFTSLSYFIGFVLLIGVPNITHNKEGNVFLKAKKGITLFVKDNKLMLLATLGAIIYALMLGIKWFYNLISEGLELPIGAWGFLASGSIAVSALGTFLARKRKSYNIGLLTFFLVLSFTAIGFYKNLIFVTGFLLLYSFLHGLFQVFFEDLINKNIPDSYRASILSVRSLITRILYALLTFVAGLVLGYLDVFRFFVLTGIVVLITVFSLYWILKGMSVKDPDYLKATSP